MERPTALTGTAGVYFVASRLAFEGFHAAVTFGNAPFVDVLASLPDGSATAALQVKTTHWAMRTRGRGDAKAAHHYEWDIGHKTAKLSHPDLFLALVDLRGMVELPDVYVVPSDQVSNWFRPLGDLKRYRYHPLIEEVEPFKNRWDILRAHLSMSR